MNEELNPDENLETTSAAENTEATGNDEPDENQFNDSPEDIKEARKYGYKPPEEYDGNPKYQISAKEYLARKEKGGTIRKLESEIQETRQAVDKMAKFHELQLKRAREEAYEKAKAEYARSITEDDLTPSEALNKYEASKTKIEQAYAEPKEEPTPQVAPEIDRFNKENPWLYSDSDLKIEANAEFFKVSQKYQGLPLEKQLEMVKRNIVERFPDKFENPKKRQQSIEGGGTVHGGVVRKKDTLQSLGLSPQDIVDVQSQIKQGIFKDESDFIKSYKILNGEKK